MLFVATVQLPERVCGERHAVVEVALGGNILEGQALDVAVGITVGDDVDTLLPHLLLREFANLHKIRAAAKWAKYKLLNLRSKQLINTLAAVVFVPSVFGEIFQQLNRLFIYLFLL